MLSRAPIRHIGSKVPACAWLCLTTHARRASWQPIMVETQMVAAARVTPPLSRKEARAAAGYVNLIPFNPTEAGDAHGYRTPSDAAVGAFHARLREEHGVRALVRWSSATGRDANGACGQLVTAKGGRTRLRVPRVASTK